MQFEGVTGIFILISLKSVNINFLGTAEIVKDSITYNGGQTGWDIPSDIYS